MNEQITREQVMNIILFKLPTLSDTELLYIKGLISGFEKEKRNK